MRTVRARVPPDCLDRQEPHGYHTMTYTEHAVEIRRLVEKSGLELPVAPVALAAYIPARRVGDLVYVSGQVPIEEGQPLETGAVPSRVSPERAKELAERCALQSLAVLTTVLEAGEGLVGVVRVGGFVASDAGFGGQPGVINGASELLGRVFGDRARHARAAVGVSALPLDVPVEIEFLYEVGRLGG